MSAFITVFDIRSVSDGLDDEDAIDSVDFSTRGSSDMVGNHHRPE